MSQPLRPAVCGYAVAMPRTGRIRFCTPEQLRIQRFQQGGLVCKTLLQGYRAHKKTPTPLGLPKDARHRLAVGS